MKVLRLLMILGVLPLVSNGSPFEIHPTAGLPTATTKRLPIKDDPNGNDVFLEAEVIVDASHVGSAAVAEESGFVKVRITFTPDGAKRFAAAVAKMLDDKNSSRQLAILCNGVVVSAPSLHTRFSEDSRVVDIDRFKSKEKAEELAAAINQALKK